MCSSDLSEDELANQNRKLKSGIMEKQSSIGIANVNSRLRAVYGDECGVSMEAGEDRGLRVVLTFKPKEGREEGREGVKDEKSNASGR